MPLTPFIAPLRGALLEQAARLLGLSGSQILRLESGPDPLRLRIEWPGKVAFSVHLQKTDTPVPASVVVGGLRLHLLAPDGDRKNPAFRALLNTIIPAFSKGDHQLFLDAWQAWAPYAGIEDDSLARLGGSTHGLAGQLRLGFRCSQDCHFCWQRRDWPSAPDAMIDHWLQEMKEAKLISFTGGEPTLHPRLPEWVAKAVQGGAEVSLQTNALRLRHANYRKTLKEAGLGSVLVSFHSADPDTSDRMTRAPGTWKHTVAGIRGCLEDGFVVALNCVVDRDNVESLASHAEYIVQNFVQPYPQNPIRVVNYSHPSLYADGRDPGLPLDEVAPSLAEALRCLQEAGVAVHATGSCGFPPCIFRGHPIQVPTADRSQAYDGDLSARLYGETCRSCSAREQCPGLRREYLARFGERGISPI